MMCIHHHIDIQDGSWVQKMRKALSQGLQLRGRDGHRLLGLPALHPELFPDDGLLVPSFKITDDIQTVLSCRKRCPSLRDRGPALCRTAIAIPLCSFLPFPALQGSVLSLSAPSFVPCFLLCIPFCIIWIPCFDLLLDQEDPAF